MSENNDKLNDLQRWLDALTVRQDEFNREINTLKNEIARLKKTEQGLLNEQLPDQNTKPGTPPFENVISSASPVPKPVIPAMPKTFTPPPAKTPAVKSDLEKFIGENLINKIGILITVFGVAIGAKYAIDHELISPLTRIILGYMVGAGLLGFAIRLKKNYENFSAVLLSGAMAIMYFITFAAYSFYAIFPQTMTFLLMVVFTIFTVIAALHYNQQVIAHIGLVGAYAVPFLLSNGSGRVIILFSYIAIINCGILAVAFKKYWKPLNYVAYILTWLIFLAWYGTGYDVQEHFSVAICFASIYFVQFYLTFLVYKIQKKEKFASEDVMLLLSNSFIYFGFGYSILNSHVTGSQLLGLFTLCNAIVHFIASLVIYRKQLADKNLFYLVSGLVLVFITIAIPVQLDGNWVTLLWAGEAALLFWIGRTKGVVVYEKLSYPLMILAFISIVQDWLTIYNNYNPDYPESRLTPVFNIHFLSSVLFIAAFVLINTIYRNNKYAAPDLSKARFPGLFSVLIPVILLVAVYFSFFMEIATYWDQKFLDSYVTDTVKKEYTHSYMNYDLNRFKVIWLLNYTFLFIAGLTVLNIRKFKDQRLGTVCFVLTMLALFLFLSQGLMVLSELRESYLGQTLANYYNRGIFNLVIRYISFVFVAIALVANYRNVQQDFIKSEYKAYCGYILHLTILWIASSELIHWMDIAHSTQSYKLGLSILWGLYSLFMIALGIWKKRKDLRIGAIVLFGITLLKLFFYDIAHLDTIAKTIVFVSLGVLLLIISFLYNKYKHVITDETTE